MRTDLEILYGNNSHEPALDGMMTAVDGKSRWLQPVEPNLASTGGPLQFHYLATALW